MFIIITITAFYTTNMVEIKSRTDYTPIKPHHSNESTILNNSLSHDSSILYSGSPSAYKRIVPAGLTLGLIVALLSVSLMLERYCFLLTAIKTNNFTYITVVVIFTLNFLVNLTLKYT